MKQNYFVLLLLLSLANHDDKIQMAEQIQHLEEKLQEKDQKIKKNEEMIQEKDQKIKESEEMIQKKETEIHNAEKKLQKMKKNCTEELEKQKKKIKKQQLIHRNDTDAQLAAIFKMLDEITLVKEDVNHRLTNISSRVLKLVADSSKSRKNQEAKDLYDRRQVLPKLVEGVENKMYETKRESWSINVEETKAIKDKDQEQYQKDEMADQKAAEMNLQEMNLNEQAPAKKHEVTKSKFKKIFVYMIKNHTLLTIKLPYSKSFVGFKFHIFNSKLQKLNRQ